MRKIILDTETTGLSTEDGHRIIEIGCVEVVNRRITGNTYHQYIQPDREIDEGALSVHGISSDKLADKPRFADIADAFLNFVRGAELVIHNAPFDVGFINHELILLDQGLDNIGSICTVLDTLVLARKQHPGQRNSLDALCKRYGVDNSQRTVHGALLDAEILADVYLAMTGGQTSMSLDNDDVATNAEGQQVEEGNIEGAELKIVRANENELKEHEKMLSLIRKKSEQGCLWD